MLTSMSSRRDRRTNIVRIDVPRGGEDRYERAAKTLQGWLNQGILATEAEPSFTIYRMRFTDSTGVRRDIAGVLGGLEVVDAEAGGVLPHERTTAKASPMPRPHPGHAANAPAGASRSPKASPSFSPSLASRWVR